MLVRVHGAKTAAENSSLGSAECVQHPVADRQTGGTDEANGYNGGECVNGGGGGGGSGTFPVTNRNRQREGGREGGREGRAGGRRGGNGNESGNENVVTAAEAVYG